MMMVKVFKLSYTQKEIEFLEVAYKKVSPVSKKNKTFREQEIKNLINSGDALDANAIMDIVSPVGDFDVFISHYHNNQDIALKVAAVLNSKGHKTFVDSQYWLHFDDVAKELNNLHYHKDSNNNYVYDHSKTKIIQKHCDVLLLSALSKVISKCKYLIFIDPPDKIVGIEQFSKQDTKLPTSYSPWIYWELFLVGLLNDSKPNLNEHFARDNMSIPKVEYPLNVKDMVKISIFDIVNDKWKEKKSNLA